MASKTHGAETDPTDDATEPTLAAVMLELLKLQQGSQDVQKAQLKQTAPKSNQFGPNRSPFNPRGEKDYPMPTLKCELHIPGKELPTYHSLTREEVELWNLVEPGTYEMELTDGSTVPFSIVGTRNGDSGAIESMRMTGLKDDTGQYGPLFTSERRQSMPAMTVYLRQILGDKAAGVLTMKDEHRLIRVGELAVSIGE